MHTMLTIDWDYFVPENPMWDLGHIENMFHITKLWDIRCATSNIKNEMRTSGEENNFWNKISKRIIMPRRTPLFVTESHAEAYRIAEENYVSSIISFDAHADLGYNNAKRIQDQTVSCENWMGRLFIDRYIKDARIIYSDKTMENPERFKEIKSRFDIKFSKQKEFFNAKKIIDVRVVHICRSGAWTPPWLDDKFYKFVAESGLEVVYNSVVDRVQDEKLIEQYRREHNSNISGLYQR